MQTPAGHSVEPAPLRPQQQPAVLLATAIAVAAAGVRLLEGIELALVPGELVAVTGPSGCGKTTLLRALAGLIDPQQGDVLLDDQPAAGIGWPVYRRRVILVEQRPTMLDTTVRRNLQRPFEYGISRSTYSEKSAIALLQRLGLEPHRLDQPARSLSVGQQQRVALMRALLLRPQVLLLDEPTSALDADAAVEVERIIREHAQQRGMSALIVTHDAPQAVRWCDRRLDLAPYIAGNRRRSEVT